MDLLSIVLLPITIILIIAGISMTSILALFGVVVPLFIIITIDVYRLQDN